MRDKGFDAGWAARLAEGIAGLKLDISEGQQIDLLRFIGLLARWNRSYNLTAVRDPMEMIPRHLLDSLAVIDYLQGRSILDVGTGAGLPGIPLAITRPERAFTLLDSNGKKTRFVQQAVMELGLRNVRVERARVEDYRPGQSFDTIIVRAFAPLSDILAKVRHLCQPGCRLLAMKGAVPAGELRGALTGSLGIEILPVKVPLLDAERNIVLISSKTSR